MHTWIFVDSRHGVKYGHGNPMRRAAEKPYVSGISQLGIRNVSSTAKEGYEQAREMGSKILSVRQVRKLGLEKVLETVPSNSRIYVTLDIDAFCPSIAPGTGTPSHGGFLYYNVLEILQGLTQHGEIVGMDLVEVAPDYDPSGSTQILAAQIILNFLGMIFHSRKNPLDTQALNRNTPAVKVARFCRKNIQCMQSGNCWYRWQPEMFHFSQRNRRVNARFFLPLLWCSIHAGS